MKSCASCELLNSCDTAQRATRQKLLAWGYDCHHARQVLEQLLVRGKRTSNGRWIEGYYLFTKNTHCIALPNTGKVLPVDPDTICRYLGVQDKHGRKIFEGDIVRSKLYSSGRPVLKHTQAVRWHEDISGYITNIADDEELDIIGNIYDTQTPRHLLSKEEYDDEETTNQATSEA